MGFWLYPIECVKSFVNNDGTLKTVEDVLDGVELEEIMNSCVPELYLSSLAQAHVSMLVNFMYFYQCENQIVNRLGHLQLIVY